MAIQRNTAQLTVDDVRHFIYDRTAKDNAIDMDLTWSDPEIAAAMRYCAMSYNAIQPYVESVDATTLPNNILFIHGTIYHLYLAKWAQLTRADLDYTAGNMTVDRVKRWIAHLEKGMDMHKTEFETKAKERKISINLESSYGCIG